MPESCLLSVQDAPQVVNGRTVGFTEHFGHTVFESRKTEIMFLLKMCLCSRICRSEDLVDTILPGFDSHVYATREYSIVREG